jgi:hypothetical protein
MKHPPYGIRIQIGRLVVEARFAPKTWRRRFYVQTLR